MGRGRVILAVLAAGVGLVAAVGVGGYLWVDAQVNAVLSQRIETHAFDMPIPFALDETEVQALREEHRVRREQEALERGEDFVLDDKLLTDPPGTNRPDDQDPLEGVDLDNVALERAVDRGRHLVTARYGCFQCHGEDLAGGVMMDAPVIATLRGPNITSTGVTAQYTGADWDRAVRHGVGKEGGVLFMPISDFERMSDRELSDIVAYLGTVPPSASAVVPRVIGPMGRLLIAAGELAPDASKADHRSDHQVAPPSAANTADFGAHLVQICVGCHRANLEGGPMAFGPPEWPPTGNLTPHEQGLAGWTFDEFRAALVDGKGRGGVVLREPMSDIPAMAKNMSEVELQAMWTYLQTLPPLPTGK